MNLDNLRNYPNSALAVNRMHLEQKSHLLKVAAQNKAELLSSESLQKDDQTGMCCIFNNYQILVDYLCRCYY